MIVVELVYRLGQIYGHTRSIIGHTKAIREVLISLYNNTMDDMDL